MRDSSLQSRGIWVAGSAMLILLAILAALQYRWLGAVSAADKERMQARMLSSAVRFARDFDRELTRALVFLGPGGPPRRERGSPADRRARWTSTALFPELVRAVFVAMPGDDRTLRLFRVDETTSEFVPEAWPADLVPLKARLEGLVPAPDSGSGPRRGRVLSVTAADIPALATPFFGAEPGPPRDSGYTILWLAEDVIERKLLPELATKHFSGATGLEDRLSVVALSQPPRVVYRAGPTTGDDSSDRFDAQVDLFGVARTDENDTAQEPAGPGSAAGQPRSPLPPQWRLRVTHPSGSLEQAVATVRHRNLAVAFGTLLLLAGGMTMLLLSTRRAQQLATQQLEFTAGVTHELATPLAGMRSAAQNLADGVISDPERVKEYGALIEREGRRLTEMVDQVLSFAGMQSGKTPFVARPLAIGKVIEDALATSQRSLDENGFRVETRLPADLPEVSGDGPALRRAVENLIANAVKYAADGSWIALGARVPSGDNGRFIEVTVEDRGPGIEAEDLPHVFDAFYRGRGRSAGALPGSGLGLTLVRNIARAHGGRVAVNSAAGKGATFTIFLPVADKAGP
jgi:signal transduction histidine kinase